MTDNINPSHYKSHPSGVECIVITEHMNFCLGNAFKYLFRRNYKGRLIEDMQKAIWYIERELGGRCGEVEGVSGTNQTWASVESVLVHETPFIGNAMFLIWRSGLKGNLVEDLKKSVWYVQREIERLTKAEEKK